jgi:hypothetical protein
MSSKASVYNIILCNSSLAHLEIRRKSDPLLNTKLNEMKSLLKSKASLNLINTFAKISQEELITYITVIYAYSHFIVGYIAMKLKYGKIVAKDQKTRHWVYF